MRSLIALFSLFAFVLPVAAAASAAANRAATPRPRKIDDIENFDPEFPCRLRAILETPFDY